VDLDTALDKAGLEEADLDIALDREAADIPAGPARLKPASSMMLQVKRSSFAFSARFFVPQKQPAIAHFGCSRSFRPEAMA
jgi:hypothetical protein